MQIINVYSLNLNFGQRLYNDYLTLIYNFKSCWETLIQGILPFMSPSFTSFLNFFYRNMTFASYS